VQSSTGQTADQTTKLKLVGVPEKSDQGIKRKLKAYHQINELFQNAGHNLNHLTRDFLDLAVEVLEAKGGSLWLMDRDRQNLTCQVATGPGSEGLAKVSVGLGKGIVGWVAEKKKGAQVKDTTKDARFKSNEANGVEPLIKTLLASPLTYRGDVLGVVEIVNKKTDGEFSQADLSFLNSLCVPAALHINTSQVLSEQHALIGRLDAMKNLQEAFSTTMELELLLALVMGKAIDLLGAEVGSIWLVEESGEGIECKIAEGPTKDKVIGVKIKRAAGIIGWVVENAKPEIVADCSKDSRFSAALDKKIGFETRSMIAAPLSVKGESIGAIQIINKRDRTLLFTPSDLEFLQLFAGNAAMYIKNARLFSAEKKAKELSALLRISGVITSTLDLDAVLMSVVNLSSDVIPYDRAAISTVQKGAQGTIKIRAISGQERVDQESAETLTLNDLHRAIALAKSEVLILSRHDLEGEDSNETIKRYMDAKALESFWASTLKDDQGELGVFSLESKSPGLITPGKKELLALLVNQSTVALRNADLYSTIPSAMGIANLKSGLIMKWSEIGSWSWRKHAAVWGGAFATFAAFVFVRLPHTVSAAVEIVPIAVTYYAEAQGKLKEILVKEGEQVEAGQLLARIDSVELRIQRDEKNATRMKIRAEMIRLLNDDKIADAKIKEKEMNSLSFEIARLDRQIEKTEVKSLFDGIVVSENLRELIGKPMNPGQEIIRIARLDQVMVEFKVAEEDVVFVKPTQEVKFKVFGHPHRTFGDGAKLISVAGEGKPLSEAAPEKFFVARAEITNSADDALRPGMTGRGRIAGIDQPLWYVVFEKPIRFVLNKLAF
jgi:GAF domain-containing protein/multidrug resistance efflux pump